MAVRLKTIFFNGFQATMVKCSQNKLPAKKYIEKSEIIFILPQASRRLELTRRLDKHFGCHKHLILFCVVIKQRN